MKFIAKGIGANPGIVEGSARLIYKAKDLDLVKEGEILICRQTDPSFVVVFGKINGIITELGGVTAHAAILSRELGIPCIVGAIEILSLAKNQDKIFMDGSNGEIYRL